MIRNNAVVLILIFFDFTARANSGEERTEISVKSSFQLNLPPHLIIPSVSIKLNETIGQGMVSILYHSFTDVTSLF